MHPQQPNPAMMLAQAKAQLAQLESRLAAMEKTHDHFKAAAASFLAFSKNPSITNVRNLAEGLLCMCSGHNESVGFELQIIRTNIEGLTQFIKQSESPIAIPGMMPPPGLGRQ